MMTKQYGYGDRGWFGDEWNDINTDTTIEGVQRKIVIDRQVDRAVCEGTETGYSIGVQRDEQRRKN